MTVTSRSYLTAGVAALGAGAIALSPIQPIPTTQLAESPHRVVNDLAVELAASGAWANLINTSVENAYTLQGVLNDNPFPLAQTFVQNQITYLKELPNIGLIAKQIFGNWGNALKAPFTSSPDNIGETIAFLAENPFTDIPLSQRGVYDLLTGDFSPLTPEQLAQLQPILDFTTTRASGAILAGIGPVLAPVLSFVAGIKATFAALKAADFKGAVSAFLDIAPNAINALLNGGPVLDLTPLVKLAGITLPAGFNSIGLNMPGLLSAGVSPLGANYQGLPGTMFDGVAADAEFSFGGLTVTAKDPGLPVGPLGATLGLTNAIAEAIKVTPPPATAALPAAADAAAPEVEAAPVVAEAPAPAVEAPAAVSEAPAEVAAPVADEAPAPKRQSRAATRADKGGSEHASRAARSARHAS